MNREKKALPLLKASSPDTKSMMPELLPPPPTRLPGMPDPRERVRARLRQISEHAARLAAAASLSAGCSSEAHVADAGAGGTAANGGSAASGGNAVRGGTAASGGSGAGAGAAAGGGRGGAGKGGSAGVAAGAGGAGGGAGRAGASGSAGTMGGAGAAGRNIGMAGYGVVDPLPPPFQCGPANAATVSGARWDTTGVIVAVQLPGPGFGSNGNTIQTVTVQPTSVKATVSSASTPGMLLLKPDLGAVWPAAVTLDIAVTCMGSTGTITWHVRVRLDTSKPAVSGDVPVEMLPSGADAGV